VDELILKHLAGESSDIEARRLEAWRASDPDHERLFRELQAVWDVTGPDGAPHERGGDHAPNATAGPPDLRLVLEEAERRRTRRGRRRLIRSPWAGWSLAAAAVVALVWVTGGGRTDAPSGPALTSVESTRGVADEVTMGLNDGSVLRLAAASTVEFPPDPDRRRVVLEGRAFFAVAESDRPFVVESGEGEVTVTGTRFEVRSGSGGMRVVVVEGEVTLSGPRGAVVLRSGQVGHLPRGERPRAVEEADVWGLLDWPGGLLLFQDTPLERVAEELGWHFRQAFVVDSALADRRVTAWFGDEELDEVVASVCLVAGARCLLEDDTVRVGR